MKNVDIILMGKTGAGKSTLVNAIFEEELAPTGKGQAVTKENAVYSRRMKMPVDSEGSGKYGFFCCNVSLYDTVGLEIDNTITDSTLEEIKNHIENTKSQISSKDIHLVWFCVNDRSSRFEPYELELIRKLSIEYEIPFIIVLTQCFSDEEGELEQQIKANLHEVSRKRVLAKSYKSRAGTIEAYGITELLRASINDYKSLKVKILEKKIDALDQSRSDRIADIERKGKSVVENYVSAATKIGFVPGGCIPIIHGMCIKMIADLTKIAGLDLANISSEEIFADVIVGLIVTPFMVVPILSSVAATAYVQTTGDGYLKAMMSVISLSSDQELKDTDLIKKRLKEELKRFGK